MAFQRPMPGILIYMMIIVLAGQTRTTLAQNETSQALKVRVETDRFVIESGQQRLADFVFNDPQILRPYLSNVRTLSGLAVTRTLPPDPSVDATDHAEMHPGIWLAFGDINGHDYWRNRAAMKFETIEKAPHDDGERTIFAVRHRLKPESGPDDGTLITQIAVMPIDKTQWQVSWTATLLATDQDIVLGDQEEMGFGTRVATPIIEKHGGRIRNSEGLSSAAATWGQAADWCEYSGIINSKPCGLVLMSSSTNVRRAWWHNRDYGLMVANPFGRSAMKQGAVSQIHIARGQSLRLRFAAVIYESSSPDAETIFQTFEKVN